MRERGSVTPYSPECVEGNFLELRRDGVLRSSHPLSHPQHDPKHQEANVHTLCRVEDDRHPCTPVAIGRIGVQQAGYERIRYYPGHVYVIKSEEYVVRHPAAASEHTFHPGKEHAPKKELLPQDRVEYRLNHEKG